MTKRRSGVWSRVTLDRDDDFDVIAEASDGREAVRSADEAKPNLVLMDVEMPEMNGLAATREILKRHPNVKVVLMSMFDDEEYGSTGLEIGAVAFIAKTKLTADLLRQALGDSDPG